MFCLCQERETSAQPKTEDRLKRLSDENKKLIHLVTALDQQLSVLEGKLTKSLAGDDLRRREGEGSADLSRAEVVRIVRENMPAQQEVDNTHRGNSGGQSSKYPLHCHVPFRCSDPVPGHGGPEYHRPGAGAGDAGEGDE